MKTALIVPTLLLAALPGASAAGAHRPA